MAKAKITVTQAWQDAATGAAVFTIEKHGDGALYFNETEDDATAYKTTGEAGEQFEQTNAVTTKVRATGDGWEVIVDGVL